MHLNLNNFAKNQSLRKSRSIEDRFLEKIQKTESCWLWRGAKNDKGYGQTCFNSSIVYAHRVSYELFIGRIRKGAYVLHRCDVPSCVNPKHLFLGTPKQNMSDMFKKGRDRLVGDKNAMAKLDWKKVRQIRRIRSLFKGMTIKNIADTYRVSQSTISFILSRKTWKEERC